MRRILITGSSGYLGRRLIARLNRLDSTPQIVGVDRREPISDPPHRLLAADILQLDFQQLLTEEQIDSVVHLAFILQPTRDRSREHQVNVDASRRLLDACRDVAVERVMVCSSATAFGAWPDQTEPHDDCDAPRGRNELGYSADKAELEGLVESFAKDCPHCITTWVRPTTVMGPNSDNFISRFLIGSPFLLDLGHPAYRMQFVHEEDVAEAMFAILQSDLSGPFNIAPPDTLTIREIAQMTRKPRLRLPHALAQIGTWLTWQSRARMFEIPPGFLWFVRYPWLVASNRLETELGFQFRYSSRETLEALFRRAKWLRSGFRLRRFS